MNGRLLSIAALATLLAGPPCGAAGPAPARRPRVSYADWPQTRFGGLRILYAAHPALASQGFAGARASEFERTLIVFPSFPSGAVFTMKDYGFGPVVRDLKIVFLDENWRVLKEDVMKRLTGESAAPPGAVVAIEGLPGTPAPARRTDGD